MKQVAALLLTDSLGPDSRGRRFTLFRGKTVMTKRFGAFLSTSDGTAYYTMGAPVCWYSLLVVRVVSCNDYPRLMKLFLAMLLLY